MTHADTFLVIARFPLDDVVIECCSSEEQAEKLAKILATEPETLARDFGESVAAWFGRGKHRPDLDELINVGVLRMLGGVVSLGFVYSVDARYEQ